MVQPADQERWNIVRQVHSFHMIFALNLMQTDQQSAYITKIKDTVMHKYTECSRFDLILGAQLELFHDWNSLPRSFQLHGLVPDNPWRELLGIFAAKGRSLHCFTSWTYLALLYRRFLLLPRGA